MRKTRKRLAVLALAAGLSITGSFLAFGAGWQQDAVGWWYELGSGAVTNQWREIEGAWYYFDQNGYMATGKTDIGGKTYHFDTGGRYRGEKDISCAGRYVDGFTLGFGSDRGGRLEIEKVENGCIWASIYSHDYSSSGTTTKGRLEGVKLENGIAKGVYQIAWNKFSDGETRVVTDTGTFELKLKNPGEYSTDRFHEGEEYEISAFSPVSVRYGDGSFEDYYLFQDEWEGQMANWFMSSEEDLF